MADMTTTQESTVSSNEAKVLKMPGVQMSIDVGKDVVIRLPDADNSYHGKVIGFDPYEFVIIAVRLPSSVRASLSNGGQVILKYLHKGTVYGFRTYVLSVSSSPTPHIFIEYPSVIEKIELRRQTRREVNLEGTLHTDEGHYDCLVVNLSSTGCKISAYAAANDPLAATKVDDTMVVAFSFGAEGLAKLPLAIRNVERRQGVITLGAMFLELNEKEEQSITQYLERVKRLTR